MDMSDWQITESSCYIKATMTAPPTNPTAKLAMSSLADPLLTPSVFSDPV